MQHSVLIIAQPDENAIWNCSKNKHGNYMTKGTDSFDSFVKVDFC